METENLHLKWNSHLSVLKAELKHFNSQPTFSDVTLSCQGRLFRTHRLVLACCSPYFKQLLEETEGSNVIVVLNELQPDALESVVIFMYCGEVEIKIQALNDFIHAANYLKINAISTNFMGLGPAEALAKKVITSESSKKSDSSTIKSSKSPKSPPMVSKDNVCNGSVQKVVPESFGFKQKDLPNAIWSQSNGKRTENPDEFSSNEDPATSQTNGATSFEKLCNDELAYPPRKKSPIQKTSIKKTVDSLEANMDIKAELNSVEDGTRLAGYNSDSIMYDCQYENEALENIQNCSNPYWEETVNSVEGNTPISHGNSNSYCSNCATSNTKLWRRSLTGDLVCNACGLYFKLHGVIRPSYLFRDAPMTRRRAPKKRKFDDDTQMDHSEFNYPKTDQENYLDLSNTPEGASDRMEVFNAAVALNSLFLKTQAQKDFSSNVANTQYFPDPSLVPNIIPQDAHVEPAVANGLSLLKLPEQPSESPSNKPKILSIAHVIQQNGKPHSNGLSRDAGSINRNSSSD